MEYTLYGIPNCDTVKKARKFLGGLGIDYEFVDFKKVEPKKNWIKNWESFLGELPVNKRGTTFRKLKEEFEKGTKTQQISLLQTNSSSIKRPILEKSSKVLAIGFNETDWSEFL
ncbi:MAG: Spx/MgsR family RNA polymerase-binding regulatory protein [Halobacteriovoraceae bacterium]|jgi:arsenate reductase (glutaredoxin)|nr:Spx/MgsR family RNA polymerase-binding regulatory protein [Halobacteriovoraceae bacterium]MBT5095136.1 Spx/MgsR family RNA polymerase-binding regulatory protein [Halobacteriovoraceae bacterium]